MTHTSFLNARKGFTLVELLVAIAIIGILLGLLLPNLSAVQQTAKAGAQSAILQGFGKGFMDFSTSDAQGRLSSSAFDHLRDGDSTKVGWLADLVNNKFGNPNKSLDPVSRMKINEKFTDLAATSSSGSLNTYRWLSNKSYQSDGDLVTDLTTARGTAYFGATQTVWDDGYNSNFATTWHFSRGDNNITSGNNYTTNGGGLDPDKCPLDGDGPLNTAMLADPTLLTTADKIALMGPARAGDSGDSTIRGTAGADNEASAINAFIDPSGRKVVAKVGDFTVESFTDGPSASRAITAGQTGVYEGATNTQVHELNDIVPNAKAKKIKSAAGPLIGGGYANIVFADGSARRLNDTNGYGGANKGDGFVGAYPVNPTATTGRKFFLDDNAYDEIKDELYVGRLRTLLTAGGGSQE